MNTRLLKCFLSAVVVLVVVTTARAAEPVSPVDDAPARAKDALATKEVAPKAKNTNGHWMNLLSCFVQDDANDCFEKQTYQVVKSWIDSARKTKQSSLLKGKPEKDKGIMDHLGDIFNFGVSRFLASFVETDEEEEETEKAGVESDEDLLQVERGLNEGRKKKKGKLKKLIALIKLLILAALAKGKITLILDKLGFLLKLKFFVVAFLHLMVALGKLWLEWSKHKVPQKVIYYEHAQHQHHYDHEHHDDSGWFGGHPGHDDKKGGWLGGIWSRSIDEPIKKLVPVSQHTTPQAYYPQDVAYSAYRPSEYPVYRQ